MRAAAARHADFGSQLARDAAEIAPQRIDGDQPAVDQRRQSRPQTPLAELRKHERDIVIVLGQAAADAQRMCQGFATSRGTSVSAAMSNPGSMSASSGNSRRSDRQNASIVEIAMSPRRPFSSRQRA